MLELFYPLVSGPVLPATLLLGCMLLWATAAIIGAVSPEGSGLSEAIPDIFAWDFVPRNLQAAGALSITFLRIRQVPLMIWLGIFSLIWWIVAITFYHLLDVPYLGTEGILRGILLTLRNWAVAVPLTRYAIEPFAAMKMQISEHVESQNLIGRECEISSYEATPQSGQAKYKTDGAPLLLNVRTDGPHLPKGTRVWITYFDAKRRVYLVSPSLPISSSEPDNAS